MPIEEDEAGPHILAPIELSIAPLRLRNSFTFSTSSPRLRVAFGLIKDAPDVVCSTLGAVISSLVGLYPPTCRSYPAILLELCAFVRPRACAGMDAHSLCDRDSGMSSSHT